MYDYDRTAAKKKGFWEASPEAHTKASAAAKDVEVKPYGEGVAVGWYLVFSDGKKLSIGVARIARFEEMSPKEAREQAKGLEAAADYIEAFIQAGGKP
jgi:hypothetical protein